MKAKRTRPDPATAATGQQQAPAQQAPAKQTGALRPTIRLHLWLESGGQVVFGVGRAQLLSCIRQHGSLRQAALALGMSYRAAWGKLRRTEQTLGRKLVDSRGQHGTALRLTPDGEKLADAFAAWYEQVERFAETSAKGLFPFVAARFGGPDA